MERPVEAQGREHIQRGTEKRGGDECAMEKEQLGFERKARVREERETEGKKEEKEEEGGREGGRRRKREPRRPNGRQVVPLKTKRLALISRADIMMDPGVCWEVTNLSWGHTFSLDEWNWNERSKYIRTSKRHDSRTTIQFSKTKVSFICYMHVRESTWRSPTGISLKIY